MTPTPLSPLPSPSLRASELERRALALRMDSTMAERVTECVDTYVSDETDVDDDDHLSGEDGCAAVAAASGSPAAAAPEDSASATAMDKSVDVRSAPVHLEGFLRKRYSSSMYMGSWRFCVLHGTRLRWYMTEELARQDLQRRGEVTVAQVEPWTGNGAMNVYPHAFAIRTASNRLLLCSAGSAEDKAQWEKLLAQALQDDKQYPQHPPHHHHHHHHLHHHLDALSMAHESAERRRIVPEDAVRAAAQAGAAAPPPPSSLPAGTSERMTLIDTDGAIVTTAPATEPVGWRSSASAVSTSSSSSSSAMHCTRCAVRFGRFVGRRVVCASCELAFCPRDCHQLVRLPHLTLDGGNGLVRKCCARCARRQEFLVYLATVSEFMSSLVHTPSAMSLLVTSTPRGSLRRASLADMSNEELFTRTANKLRYGPMSLVRTIKILYQTRQKPQLFCLACERLPFYVENCVDRVENLWYQILHLFQCCDSELNMFSVQLLCLQRYIGAICRRSPRIALQTIWHVQAAMEDASRHHPHSLLALLGFLYPVSMGSSIWGELLLADTPEPQRRQVLTRLALIHAQCEQVIANEPDSMMERWLNARSVVEFDTCASELSASGIQLCDYQSSIFYDSLEMDGTEATRGHLEDVVAEQVRFVQSLAAISERLRHVHPVERRTDYLGGELEQLNANLSKSALYPLCAASEVLYQVVRIPPTEGKVFSTKMRAPTLIFLEAVPLDAANAVGDTSMDRLRPFMSSRRGNLTFLESIADVEVGGSGSRDSLSSSADSSNNTPTASTPHHKRHGSQLSCPEDVENMSSAEEDAASSPKNDEEVLTRSVNLKRHMTFPHDDGSPPSRSESACSLPTANFSLGKLAQQEPRHNAMENIVYDSKVYGESWEERCERIRQESPHGHLPGWKLFSIIVKTNDDLRQEMFTMQLITKFKSVFDIERLNLWLRTYSIVATGANIGLLETINDSCSLDHLKKSFAGGNMFQYFKATYGDPQSPSFESARRNFIRSMAAYSILSYVLLVKDRHNGNILLDSEGHIIHIDFGFILGIAPGGRFSIEDAPFKLTEEMAEIMGGITSMGFAFYRKLMVDGFMVLQKYHSEIVALVQTTGNYSPFPCFEGTKLSRVVTELRGRLCVGLTKRQVEKRVDYLIKKSFNAWGTRKYDSFQLRSNNIQP